MHCTYQHHEYVEEHSLSSSAAFASADSKHIKQSQLENRYDGIEVIEMIAALE